MAGRLTGKIALITGGASGIGLATSQAFSREGASVVIADFNRTRAEEAARSLPNCIAIRTDVTDEAQVEAAVALALDRFGKLDCMINNAGIVGSVGSIATLDPKHWADTLAVLLTGVAYGMKHAARAMLPRKEGCIISLASTAGIVGGLGSHAYTAAKHGVVGITKSAAAELAPHGIRVNAVAPSITVTPMVDMISGSREESLANSARRSPMKRPILAEDIAGAMVFLASDDARNITSHVLPVDAGLTTMGFPTQYDWSQPRFIETARPD